MHKLLLHQWCDGTWTWQSSKDAKAHPQIITLLNNYITEKRRHLPFLTLRTIGVSFWTRTRPRFRSTTTRALER